MLTCPECRATFPDGTPDCPRDRCQLLPSEAILPDPDPPLEPGTMVGEYQVQHKLGSGTFGDVYAGEQPLIGKKVAIKVLRDKFASDPRVVARFVAEARAVNKIRHRNIIDIFSFGMLEGQRHYFVMELCAGRTLGDLLDRERRLPVGKALPILRGIASALDAAHAAGVTHRDLKPDNIVLVVEEDGSYFPKLLDFGVAKLVADDAPSKTATGVAIGTPRYMAPEQCRGRKVDHRADIYALGVVIHEMLTGDAPFDGESAMDLMLKHTTDPPPRMSSVWADLPPELDAPVLAMLAKQPNARPQSAGAAVAALAERANATGGAATVPSLPAIPEVGVEQVSGVEIAAAQSAPAGSSAALTVANPRTGEAPAGETLKSGRGTVVVAASAASGTLRSHGEAPGGVARTVAEAPTGTVAEAPLLASPVPARAPPAKRGAWPLVAVAVTVAGVAVAAVALVKGSGAPASPALPSSASAAPAEVTIRFAVDPSDADVMIDGRRAGSARDPLTLPRSDQPRAVRLEKDGFEGQVTWIVPNRDQIANPVALKLAAPVAPPLQTPPSATAPKPRPAPGDHSDLERPVWKK